MKNSKSYQVAQADLYFNKYIRLRDYGEPCISCNRYFKFDEMDAGHYRSKAAAPELRYNEDNVHAQCRECNSGFASGNRKKYMKKLILKIGVDRVEKLELYTSPFKMTIDDIFNLRKKYQKKCESYSCW